MQSRLRFNNEEEWTITKKYKLCVKDDYLYASYSSIPQEKLLVKFSHHYHAPTEITFADNQDKFESRTTSAPYILND